VRDAAPAGERVRHLAVEVGDATDLPVVREGLAVPDHEPAES
jgi:hypothetical protein